MNLSLENPTDAVFVIESLRPGDPRTGQDVLCNAISPHARRANVYAHIPAFPCLSIADLDEALTTITSIVAQRGLSPVLQFDCHGGPDGFQLANAHFLSWVDFSARMLPLNEAAKNTLLVVASACMGAYLARALARVYRLGAADPLRGRAPFWGIVGPTEIVPSDSLRRGLEAFYMELLGNNSPDAGLRRMSGHFAAEITYAEVVHARGFSRYITHHLNPDFVDQRIATILQEAPDKSQHALRNHIMDFESRFREYRTRYLWLDRFPSDRFPINYAQMLTLDESP